MDPPGFATPGIDFERNSNPEVGNRLTLPDCR
jgi:hypothetical protein